MDAQVFIQKVAAGEAGDAKDTLTDMLSSKAFEALDARKQEIARTLYGETPDVEVQDTADSEVEEDELLTQEEFIALSDEDQELYLEALEQLDEIGDTPAGRQALGKYVKKRTKQLPQIEVGYQMAEPGRELKGYEKLKKKVNKGIGRAVDRLAKEEVEELDEVSKKLLRNYLKGSRAENQGSLGSAGHMSDKARSLGRTEQDKEDGRYEGQKLAKRKLGAPGTIPAKVMAK
jgi:hypothetical protein